MLLDLFEIVVHKNLDSHTPLLRGDYIHLAVGRKLSDIFKNIYWYMGFF